MKHKKNIVFSSLTGEVEGLNFKQDKKISRIQRRFTALKNRLLEGKELNYRRAIRYISWARVLKEEVPQYIIDRSSELEKNKYRSPIREKRRENRVRKPVKYDAYIKSKKWAERRNKYFKKFGRYCDICRSFKYIQLHHMFYGNFGEEKDEHLIPLCKEHHDKFHKELGKTKKDMTKETKLFIEKEKLKCK